MFAFFRNVTFLLMLCGILAVSTATLAVKTFSVGARVVVLTAEVASLTATIAANAALHRKALAVAKAKGRLKRMLIAIPILGVFTAVYFEGKDWIEWQEVNPEGTPNEYACEVINNSGEIIDDLLQNLPAWIRSSRDWVISKLPDCTEPIQGKPE